MKLNKLIALLLAVTMLFAFVGCPHNNEDPAPTPSNQTPSSQTPVNPDPEPVTPVEGTFDIKDGLVAGATSYEIKDLDGLKKLIEIVNGTPAVEAQGTEGEEGYVPAVEAVAGNSLAGVTITLANDITINQAVLQDGFVEPAEGADATANADLINLDSIGQKGAVFAGTFDGNGKVISGLYIYQGHQGLGFIGATGEGAVIKNVIIKDACVINNNASAGDDGSDDDRFGGLLGLATGSTTIDNCVFIGVVGSAAAKGRGGAYEYIGGLIGRCDAAVSAKDCIVLAKVYGEDLINHKGADKLTKENVTGYKAEDIATIDTSAITNEFVKAYIEANKPTPAPANPVLGTAAGAVAYGTAIDITCATEGAAIVYKFGEVSENPADYTTYSAETKPVIKGSVTLNALAVVLDESGAVLSRSEVVSAAYSVAVPATPVISPAGGSFTAGEDQTVTITTETAGAFIVYKFGAVSENPADYTPYNADSKPVISADTTIVAIAIVGEEGNYVNSEPATAAFVFEAPVDETLPTAENPVISPEAVIGGYNVTITCATEGVSIYYADTALTSTTAATAGTAYTGAFKVEATGTLYVIAVKDGYNSSKAQLDIEVPAVADLAITPAAGAYAVDPDDVTEVTIAAEDGAVISYSVNGENFVAYDPANKPVIDAAKTITVKAEKAGKVTSTTSAEYTVLTVAAPVFAPESGSVPYGQEITITAEEGASIYYLVNLRANPDQEETLYDSEDKPVLTDNTSIIAVAIKTDALGKPAVSEQAGADYTVVRVAPGNPYPETYVDGADVPYKSRLRFYADAGTEESGKKKATVYWQFVEPGAQSTLTANNYEDEEIATEYDGSIGIEEHTSGGSYYCIAVNDGLTSTIVSFTYTWIAPPGRADGLAAAAEKIAAMTHAAEITGLVDVNTLDAAPTSGSYIVKDADGLDKIAAWVTGGATFEGVTIIQAADITFNATVNSDAFEAPVEATVGTPAAGLRTFAGIGNASKAFAGTYDGNGYKISGMYIYGDHATLGFVCLSTTTTVLKNIVLYDASVVLDAHDDDNDNRVGGILGKAGGVTTIQNCVYVGSVGSAAAAGRYTTEYFSADIGDGGKTASTITDCLFVARITAKQTSGVKCQKNQSKLIYTNVTTFDAENE